MEGEDKGRVASMGRAEIDTRAPFRSVKEAVSLFGERVLAGEIYAKQLKELKAEASEKEPAFARIGALEAELEETKQSLQQAIEENSLMQYCIKSVREELEQARAELQKLKAKVRQKQPMIDPEIEDLKFIENPNQDETKPQREEERGLQRKRNVQFASPPSLARVIISKEQFPPRSPSSKKTKRKPLVPILGWLFTKKKGDQESESQTLEAVC